MVCGFKLSGQSTQKMVLAFSSTSWTPIGKRLGAGSHGILIPGQPEMLTNPVKTSWSWAQALVHRSALDKANGALPASK